MQNLFEKLKRSFVRAGASIEVTLKSLSLGSQHATTGIYIKGYASSTIDMVLIGKNVVLQQTAVGAYTQTEQLGITDTQVFEGDEIEDADGYTFLIIKVTPQNIGDQNVFYECVLRSTLPDAAAEGRVYPLLPPPTEGGITLNVGACLFEPLTVSTSFVFLDDAGWMSNVCSASSSVSVDGPRNPQALTCSVSTVLSVVVV